MNNDIDIFVSAHYHFLRAAPTSTASEPSPKVKGNLPVASL